MAKDFWFEASIAHQVLAFQRARHPEARARVQFQEGQVVEKWGACDGVDRIEKIR